MDFSAILSLIVPLVLTISVFTLLFIGIAKLEVGKNTTRLFDEASKNLIYYPIYLFVGLVILLLVISNFLNIPINSSTMLWIVLGIKLIVSFWVSSVAGEMNRNPFLWFILGFLEFHAAFIALALGKKIYKIPSGTKDFFQELNKKTNERVFALKDLTNNTRNSGYKSAIEAQYSTPLRTIKNEYSEEFNAMVKNTTAKKIKDSTIRRLDKALSTGLMTQEEYDKKLGSLK